MADRWADNEEVGRLVDELIGEDADRPIDTLHLLSSVTVALILRSTKSTDPAKIMAIYDAFAAGTVQHLERTIPLHVETRRKRGPVVQ